FVVDGRHVRERFARQLFADPVLLRQLLRLPIEHIRRAGIHVRARADDEQTLVFRGRPEREVLAGQRLLEQRVVRLERLVLPDITRLVVDVDGRDQLIADVGKQHVSEIDTILRVRFDELFGAGLRVEQREADEVHALVRFHVDTAAVLREVTRPAGLEDVARIHFREAVVVDAHHLGVAVLVDARREPQLVREVELPRDHSFGVLADERALAARDANLVQVVPRFVAVVEADVDGVGVALRHEEDLRPYAPDVGDVARGGHVAPGCGGVGRPDGIDVEVLVAGRVLRVQNVFRVAAPEVRRDRPFRIGGDRAGLVERLRGPLYPDVARGLERLEERDELAVGRNLRAGDFGVAG